MESESGSGMNKLADEKSPGIKGESQKEEEPSLDGEGALSIAGEGALLIEEKDSPNHCFMISSLACAFFCRVAASSRRL